MIRAMMMFLAFSMSLFAWQNAVVGKVIDGDTLILKDVNSSKSFKARLIGVDTFETRYNHKVFSQLKLIKINKFSEVFKLGKSAKEYTESKVRDQTIRYFVFGTDKYGRKLVWISGLNYLLVVNGYATVFKDIRLPSIYMNALVEAEHEAKKEKRGIYEKR